MGDCVPFVCIWGGAGSGGIQAIRRSYNVVFFHESFLSNLGCGTRTDNIAFLGGTELQSRRFSPRPSFRGNAGWRMTLRGGIGETRRGGFACSCCDCLCLWWCLLMLPSDLGKKAMPARNEMRETYAHAEMNVGQAEMERGVTPNWIQSELLNL